MNKTAQEKLVSQFTKYGKNNDLSLVIVDFHVEKCLYVRHYKTGDVYYTGEYKHIPDYSTRRIVIKKVECWIDPDAFDRLTNC